MGMNDLEAAGQGASPPPPWSESLLPPPDGVIRGRRGNKVRPLPKIHQSEECATAPPGPGGGGGGGTDFERGKDETFLAMKSSQTRRAHRRV
jgi:hypothetical protein